MSMRRLVSALAFSALAVGLAACSSPSVSAPTVSLTPSAVVSTPSPSPPPPVVRSVLSGRVDEKDGPVLAVKLDNTTHSEPHAGLNDADVVYLEQVEGGLSRYLAVFSTRIPKVIGPIRSARIADLELLPEYGKVAFAFSGANPLLRPVIAQAPLYDVSGDRGSTGYWRQPGRYPPYDFFGDGKTLLKRAPHAVKAHSVGFTFDDAVQPGGRKVSSVTTQMPSARSVFTWSKKESRWLLTMDGITSKDTKGVRLGGTTVIVQYVKVYPSIYGHGGSNTPMSDTVGKGKALILRDGRAYNAKWSRPTKEAGTRWTVQGQEFPLAPGQVWVVLLNNQLKAQQQR